MASKGDDEVPDGCQSRNISVETASILLKTEVPKGIDPELDAILDSALEDFDKIKGPAHPLISEETAVGACSGAGPFNDTVKGSKDSASQNSASNPQDGYPEEASYDFLADAMSKQFEETFSALLNDPNLKKQFEELADSAEEAASSNNAAAFAETVEKALSGLSLNAEQLQDEPSQQELWQQLAESMGAEAGGGEAGMEAGLGAMGGMFQNMVKQLLSKELLYQPLTEVTEKYKEYLDTNKQVLEAEKLVTYNKQFEIIQKVVLHLEGDSETHTEEEKNVRFEALLDLLQQMYELGNPPTEVVGEGNLMMPNLGDLGSLGKFPGMGGIGSTQDPSQCVVM